MALVSSRRGSMRRAGWHGCLSCLALLLALFSTFGRAQELPSSALAPITAETIESRLDEVSSATDLDETLKGRIKQLYTDARQQLQLAQQADTSRASFEEMSSSAAGDRQSIQQKLATPADTELDLPATATLTELQQRLSDAEAEGAQAKEELARLNAEPSRRQLRQRDLPTEIATATQRLEEIEKQLATAPPPGEHAALTAARLANLQAEQQALEAQLAMFEQEQGAYAATTELLPLERDWVARQAAAAETRRRALAERIATLRRAESSERVDAARREVAQTHPVLRPLAERNRALAENAKETVDRLSRSERSLKRVQDSLDKYRQQFERTREKVESVGLTYALGILLRSNRDQLAKARGQHRPSSNREDDIRQIQLDILELEDERAELADREAVLGALRRRTNPDDWTPAIEADARKLLDAQSDTLDELILNLRTLFEALVATDSAERQLVEVIDDYASYIEGRILWVRSAPPVGLQEFRDLSPSLLWLFKPGPWIELHRALMPGILDHLLLYLAFSAGILFLLYQQHGLRRRLRELGKLASQRSCREIGPTLEALLATLGIAALWPTIFCFLGWRIYTDGITAPLSVLVSNGLVAAGAYLLMVEIMRQVCRPQGLGPAHLEWSPQAALVLRRRLRWLVAATVLVFLAGFFQYHEEEAFRWSLGRFSFVGLWLMLLVVIQRWTRPRGPFFEGILQRNPSSVFYRLRHPISLMIIALPMFMLGLAITGYYFSAYRLSSRLLATLYVVVGVVLLYDVLLRSIVVRHRRLAYRRRQQLIAEAASDSRSDENRDADIVVAPEPEIELNTISHQTRQLIRVVLMFAALLATWMIWSDFLPALGLLDDITIWKVSVGTSVEIITVRHLLSCIAILFLTAVSVKNLPGLLELVFLQRLPLDAGARYAIATISRYAIAIVGVIIGLNMIRIQWSQYSWLVAAATVGLGFGLQEIFANFVSGLIVLLERPVRVGDVVTVDNTTGVVSRIHMRATVVTNWDRQELIVPNKEFVTNKLLNWTLSNSTSRIVIQVGVAYGTDTRKTHDLLVSIVRAHPSILREPEPLINLESLGDSTLNFVIRCYVGMLSDRLPTTNDLYEAIHSQFADQGIVIAFPQRDLHLCSWPERALGLNRQTEHDSNGSTKKEYEAYEKHED